MPVRLTALTPAVLLVAGLAVACGSTSSTASGDKVGITATDTACTLASSTVPAGSTTFLVSNKGNDVTEVYVYQGTRTVTEVENIGPGTSRDMTATLEPGDYEIACKPGQKGDGIRTELEVTGTTGGSGGTAAKVDRTVSFTAHDNTFEGDLVGFTGKVGQTVEFTMTNTDKVEEHEWELVGPDGAELGEIGETEPGGTGSKVVTFAAAGTYTYKCTHNGHDVQGMKGSFTVS